MSAVYIYIHIYIYMFKKNETMPFVATQMDLAIIILSEVTQTNTIISYDIAYIWNLKRCK